jgi:tol-pal system protein YbgF
VLAELRSLDARSAETQQTLRDAASEVVRLRTRVEATEDDLRQSRTVQSPRAAAVALPPMATAAPAPIARAPLVAAPPVVSPSSPGPDAPRESREETPEQAFAAALKTFRAREHGQAVLELIDFVAKYPKHGLVPRAQYWIGEAYYVQRDYPQALLEFKRVLEMDPGALAAADAWLRIGMCHASLHQPAPATAAWQRVVREYPRTEAADKARSFLRAAAAVR